MKKKNFQRLRVLPAHAGRKFARFFQFRIAGAADRRIDSGLEGG
jgi:hypothetical protein